jgi:hypothetical protein
VARGFPVLADNHLQQAVVEGLVTQGWDVVRAIDVFPEGTDDAVLFGHAIKEGRVFPTTKTSSRSAITGWRTAASSQGSSTGTNRTTPP